MSALNSPSIAENLLRANIHHAIVLSAFLLIALIWPNIIWAVEPPTRPGSIVGDISSSGAPTLTWAAVSGATHYKIQHQVDSSSWDQVYNYAGNAAGAYRTTTLSSLSSSGGHRWRVKACIASGSTEVCSSSWRTSPRVNYSIAEPPSRPSSLSAEVNTSTGKVELSWVQSSSVGSFKIQRQYNGGSWGHFYTAGGSQRSYTTGTLQDGSTYRWRIESCETSSGTVCSADAGSAGYRYSSTVTVVIAPQRPGSIVGDISSSGAPTLTWAAVSGATHYKIQHQVDSSSWDQVYNYAGNAAGVYRTTTLSSLSSSGGHRWRVKACKTSGGSEICSSSWRTSPRVNYSLAEPPPRPSSLSAEVNTSTGKAELTWVQSSTAGSFKIQQQNNSGSWGHLYTAGGSQRSYTTDILQEGSTYRWRIESCETSTASVCSADNDPAGYRYSTTVTVVIAPTRPGSIVGEISTSGEPTLTWAAVNGATHYEIEQQVDSDAWHVVYEGSGSSTGAYRTTVLSSLSSSGGYRWRVKSCETFEGSEVCSPDWRTSPRVDYVLLPPPYPTGGEALGYTSYIQNDCHSETWTDSERFGNCVKQNGNYPMWRINGVHENAEWKEGDSGDIRLADPIASVNFVPRNDIPERYEVEIMLDKISYPDYRDHKGRDVRTGYTALLMADTPWARNAAGKRIFNLSEDVYVQAKLSLENVQRTILQNPAEVGNAEVRVILAMQAWWDGYKHTIEVNLMRTPGFDNCGSVNILTEQNHPDYYRTWRPLLNIIGSYPMTAPYPNGLGLSAVCDTSNRYDHRWISLDGSSNINKNHVTSESVYYNVLNLPDRPQAPLVEDAGYQTFTIPLSRLFREYEWRVPPSSWSAVESWYGDDPTHGYITAGFGVEIYGAGRVDMKVKDFIIYIPELH